MSDNEVTSSDIDNVLNNIDIAVNNESLSKEAGEILKPVIVNTISNDIVGLVPSEYKNEEVTLISILIDDSQSIDYYNNKQIVIDGHNIFLDVLSGSNSVARNNSLIHTSYINNGVLFPFTTIDKAVKMDNSNYSPGGGTPLYDSVVEVLGKVALLGEEYYKKRIRYKTITVIITDGEDCGGKIEDPKMVSPIVNDMLDSGEHSIYAYGIDVDNVDLYSIFIDMGIKDEYILTTGNSESEIREAFNFISKSSLKGEKLR